MLDEPPFVAVLDRSDVLVRSLAKAVDQLAEPAEVQLYTRPAELQAVFETTAVAVLLVGPSELTTAGLRRVARWHAEHPETVVVVAAEREVQLDPLLLMKAGAESLLRLPAGPAAVRRVLTQALDVAARQREALTTVVVEPTPAPALDEQEHEQPEPVPEEPEPEPETEPEPEPQELLPPEPAITITVASATGGCGKTFLATNLAFLLATGTGKRVAMIDLDVQFGELAPTLRLRPAATLADVSLDEDGHVDIAGLMTSHTGGFDVLAAPPDPLVAEGLDHGVVRAAVDALRQNYDFVIIDTPPTLNEVVLDAFDVSDHLIVLATLDVPSIRNMKVFLSTLDRLRIRQDGVHLVLNKAERHVELTSGDIQTLLGRTWDLELPYDREVSRSVNLGLPVSEAAPHCQVSRRLVAGVGTLVPDAELHLSHVLPEPPGWHRFMNLFRRPPTPLFVEEKVP